MSDSKILVLAAVAAIGAVLLMNKAGAAARPAGSASAPIQEKNMNNALWASLLGTAWTSLRGSSSTGTAPAFSVTDLFSQAETRDGRPITQTMMDFFPATYGAPIDYTSDVSAGGEAFIDAMFPVSQLDW